MDKLKLYDLDSQSWTIFYNEFHSKLRAPHFVFKTRGINVTGYPGHTDISFFLSDPVYRGHVTLKINPKNQIPYS